MCNGSGRDIGYIRRINSKGELVKRTAIASLLVLAVAATAGAAEKTLSVIKDKSSIGFVGRKVTGHHNAVFHAFDGGVVVDGTTPKSVDFAIDLNTVQTESPRLDNHLKSGDFWDVANHPKATFKSSRIARKGPDEYEVSGIFTLRGISNPISFPAKVTKEGDTTRVKSEFSINRQKWNVAYKGAPDNLIADDVEIKLDLVFPNP